MTPDQLITFAAVAEHRNISRASVALHLSQPAVSGQLRQLQDEFGEPLYLRDGRGVRLTPAGEQLASYAARLRDTWRQAHAYRDALRGMERGTLRIGASTTPASYLLPYLIAAFQRGYPDVTLHTAGGNTSEIVGNLGSLDIALIEGVVGPDLPPDTAVHPWREDEIVAIMPRTHPLAETGRGQGVSLAQLSAEPVVLREEGSGVRQLVERAFADAGLPVRVVLEIAGVEGVKEAVRAGMGISFVSAMSMRHEDDALCRCSFSPQLTRRLSILVPHASAPSRLVGRFLEMCLAES
ncbi:LysR family transcriptional regulator [Paraburkholderia sp. SARCC-3016]|uniref:LysR family transcriptional regulator n=1 Tax=Paraburkholderia sp. SARCC-3016 TaxID=3058611 RepID=UPI0028093F47|nr:LysR family transcriptional regulator [Paraburkholderia sp. SARCC-3016]MDQ7977651.1 LysR family transcriptional regulator [Paraburkholderia sp. SARCC-3016]